MRTRLFVALFALFALTATANDKQSPLSDFVRVIDHPQVGEVLECSIRTYMAPKPDGNVGKRMFGGMGAMLGKQKKLPPRPNVVLVSMIHFGEEAFFAEVKKVLATADLVLYEEQGNDDMNAMQADMIRMATGLHFQGAEIPHAGNKTWRSADLTQDQLFRMLGIHPDTIKKMQGMMKGMKITPKMLEANPQMKSMLPTREQIMGQMRSGAPSMGEQLGGKVGDVILRQRNMVAMGELTRASYEDHKTIVLIYGAAHMPEIEAYLTGPLAYVRTGERWVKAVYADPEAAAGQPAPGRLPAGSRWY